MTDQQQIAALRKGIQRAGRKTGRTRRILVWSLIGAAAAVVAHALVALPRLDPGSPLPIEALGIALCFGVGFALLIALPSAVLYRLRCLGAMRRHLARLPPEARAAVLLPLPPDASQDARSIAESLRRGFGMRTELIPASAPDARGDEASPAEGAP
jgi:hypothetical protein